MSIQSCSSPVSICDCILWWVLKENAIAKISIRKMITFIWFICNLFNLWLIKVASLNTQLMTSGDRLEEVQPCKTLPDQPLRAEQNGPDHSMGAGIVSVCRLSGTASPPGSRVEEMKVAKWRFGRSGTQNIRIRAAWSPGVSTMLELPLRLD